MDKLIFSSFFFLLEGGGTKEGCQDTPRYTHLKSKKGYSSKGSIFGGREGQYFCCVPKDNG